MLVHRLGPFGDLRVALGGGHGQKFAMVKSIATAPAGEIGAVEKRGESRRRFAAGAGRFSGGPAGREGQHEEGA